MGVNKVQLANGETLVDMSDATATAATILEGYTAYGADGELIVGTAASTARKEVTATLPASSWTSNTQVVTISEVTENATVIVSGDTGNDTEYISCGVYCSGQRDMQLVFSCVTVPKVDLVVHVAILK